MIYTVGPISGCHLNPAVTLGMVLSRKFDARRAPGYMATQVVGSTLAAALLYAIAAGNGHFDAVTSGFASNGYGARSPDGYGITSAFLIEVALTVLLVLTILGSTDFAAPVGFGGIAIGLCLTLIHLVSIPVTNTSVNPARSITRNPLALGAAAAFVGIIAGALIPTLQKEEEALGSVATKLRVAGRDLAQDVVDHGGQVVGETLAAAKGSADAHGLSGAKPVGELFADVKSGALAEDIRQVAFETLQAGRDSTQTHLAAVTETAQPEADTQA